MTTVNKDHKFDYHIFEKDEKMWFNETTLSAQDIESDDECECENDDENGFLVGVESGRIWDFRVLSTDIPEFKTKMCKGWTKIPFDGRVSYKYPCAYKRNCRKTFYVRVAYSGSSTGTDIESAVKECAEGCIKASLPLIVTGQLQAAIAAIWSCFKICIATKVAEDVSKFSVDIHVTKKCDNWHKI